MKPDGNGIEAVGFLEVGRAYPTSRGQDPIGTRHLTDGKGLV